MDLAEREFRRAIEQRPGLDNLYNDLGYVLQSQARYDEAAEWFTKALEVEPKNAIARDNLARLLYQTEEFRPSLIQHLKLMDTIMSSDAIALNDTVGEPYGEQDLVEIYRNMANIYYTVGVLDDATCYSWLAHILGANTYQAGQHARMLLSIDKNTAALITLRDVFVANGGRVPAKLLLDYGIALYLGGNTSLAKTAAGRVLTQRDAERIDRRTARLLSLLVSSEKERTLLTESLFEEEPKICELEVLDSEQYWPIQFYDSVEKLVMTVCEDVEQSVPTT